jgi:L-histidine Nalpha-methyltransferase
VSDGGPPATMRYHLDVRADETSMLATLADDVQHGLTGRPRSLPPKYFYDAVGSELFERITELPEYYLTRVEDQMLQQVAPLIMRRLEPRDVVELGPGSCTKARRFLDAVDHSRPIRYVPVDIGADALPSAAQALLRDYPSLRVHAVIADFERDLARLPIRRGRRLILFLGSTIGNFEPFARKAFLAQVRQNLGADGRFLLGLDLVKDQSVLEAAYNDAAGVTAEFNRNVLHVVNRVLDGDFRPERFRHHAFYSAEASRIEMHLIATAPQRVELRRLGLRLDFALHDDIWTENSYKFTRQSTESMLADAGLALEQWYTDDARLFGLALARPTLPP